MNLSLRKRTEPMLEPPAPVERKYHPDVVATFDSIARTRDERDRLADDNVLLKESLTAARREVEFLKVKLLETTHDRDFYQRHYVALHARLSDMGVMIENAIREASREANAAGMTPHKAEVAAVEAVDEAVSQKPEGEQGKN